MIWRTWAFDAVWPHLSDRQLLVEIDVYLCLFLPISCTIGPRRWLNSITCMMSPNVLLVARNITLVFCVGRQGAACSWIVWIGRSSYPSKIGLNRMVRKGIRGEVCVDVLLNAPAGSIVFELRGSSFQCRCLKKVQADQSKVCRCISHVITNAYDCRQCAHVPRKFIHEGRL